MKVNIPKKQLDPKQIELCNLFEKIGNELCSFYIDIHRVKTNNELHTRTPISAHLARELDGGLRDIFANRKEAKEYCNCKKPSFKDNICSCCSKIKKPTHKETISQMLNLKIEHEIVKKWHELTQKFPSLAHRNNVYGDPRNFAEFESIWKEYEELLKYAFGSSSDVLNRIDSLIKEDFPAPKVKNSLSGLIKESPFEPYFFSNLKKVKWLKPLNEVGFFNPADNPKPKLTEDGKGYYILSWSVFRYLEWVSENLPTDNENVVKELVSIIDAIINYRGEKGERIQNFRTDFGIFKILNNIPSDYIKEEHIDFIQNSLDINFHGGLIGSELSKGFITKLIQENNKKLLLKLIDIICSFKKINNSIEPLIEEYWFAELIKKHKDELAKYSGKDIIEIIITKINEIKKEDTNSFSVAWIPTIEAHEQKSFPERYESQLIDLLVECLVNLTNENLVQKTKDLLKNKIDILKRIGFYLINLKFDLLKDLFFALDYNPLEDFYSKHELYELLESNATTFSDDQVDIIIKWIENKKYYLDGVKDEEKESVLAYRKKEWYLALVASTNKSVQENYTKYNEINDTKPEHPGFVSWSTTWMGESTPMEEFQIEKSTVDELVKAIKNFKEEDKGFKKPTVRGFADTIQKDVEKQPSKYYESLDKFKEVDLAYVCSIVRGFINICRKNNDKKEGEIIALDWEKILNFLNGQIDDSFWKMESHGEFNYRDWFISEVANLIEDGTKHDRTAFDVKLLPIAKEILLKLTKHDIFYPINGDDYVSFALNSTEGKILDAMLNYSLRVYGVVEKKWDEDIKKYFTEKITEKKYIEVFTIVGQYLPQFNTLDKKWVASYFDLIFPLGDLNILKASISGLFFNSTVYSNFYSLFKEKGIYKSLLDSWEENNNNLNESLLRHICLGYAEKWEEIKDTTLIKELLGKYDALEEVVRFFWIIAKNIKQDYIARVKELWKYISNNNQDTPINGKLMQLLRIFDELDDVVFDLCIKGAKFVNTHDIHYVIEYLVKYIDFDVEKVGKILLELVKNVDIISEYRKEDAIKIVEKLYSENMKELANEICNKYFEKQGLQFLREIYNINNAQVE